MQKHQHFLLFICSFLRFLRSSPLQMRMGYWIDISERLLNVKTTFPSILCSLLRFSRSLPFPSLPDARQADHELATDNAVSALGSLLEAQRDSLGGAEGVGRAWELWLGYMPLRADEEEAEKVRARGYI